MTTRRHTIGTACGIAAAVCYGTNPLGALNLYQEGLNTPSVLLCRFGLAWIIIALVLMVRRESWRVTPKQFATLSLLGMLFACSSASLYLSFRIMAAGVASTILFTYPVMTAVIMVLFFGERIRISTILSVLLALVGVLLLYWSDTSDTLPADGVALVLLSALTYALYIIAVDKSKINLSAYKINFYVLFYCALGALILSVITGQGIALPTTFKGWFYTGWLAIVPAIMALVLMVYAAQYIGSTATAIMGALEPLTAVLIGILLFGEPFGIHLAIGIVLILAAVVIIAVRKTKTQ
ncbi:MAG: DMT family transporter [Bacteroidales bacterium]|nr:DMT family transporter [Candidatus Colimorpha onthohippi]